MSNNQSKRHVPSYNQPGYVLPQFKQPILYNQRGLDQQTYAQQQILNSVYRPIKDKTPVPGIPLYGESTTSPNLRKFVVQGYKDVWCAILFILCFLAVVSFGIYNFVTISDYDSLFKNDEWKPAPTKVGICLAFGIVTGAFLALVSLLLFRCAPRACIIFGNIMMVLYLISFGIWMIKFYKSLYGILFIISGIIYALFFYLSRKAIPYSAVLLSQSAKIIQNYPAITFFNVLSVIFLLIWLALWSAMLFPYVSAFSKKDKSLGASIGVSLFGLFALYWTLQVSTNTLHVVVSGVVATWYFNGSQNMPPNPTLYSVKRAITTSFGSICFGSLIVAILEFIRALLRSQKDDTGFFACIIDCILACIQGLIELFNEFAFVYCAIYGYSYIQAAKATFNLIKSSAFYGLYTNAVTKNTLFIFSLIFAIPVGVFGGLIFRNVVLGVLLFISTFGSTQQFLSVLQSAITALFVCVAEEPETMAITAPELYAELVNAQSVMA